MTAPTLSAIVHINTPFMQRTFLLLLLVPFLAVPALAQPRAGGQMPAGGTVRGVVLDNGTSTPLRRASVTVRNPGDSSLVTGVLTDSLGRFSLTGLRPGKFIVRISYVGFDRYNSAPFDSRNGEVVELGTVRLEQSKSNSTVTVQAQREFMTQEIDRTVYRTDQLITSGGGTALDVLQNIPQVQVDVDGAVSLRGNQNITVMINGRPLPISGAQLTTLLRSFPAGTIDRIEVIPNPSAKYDPDGVGGIINIVLKQGGNEGLNGGFDVSASTTLNSSLSGNLGYRTGPWTIFGSYGLNYNNHIGEGTRNYYNKTNPTPVVLDQVSGDTSHGLGHSLTASIDYALDQTSTISLSAVGNISSGTEHDLNNYTESVNGATTRRYNRAQDGEENDNSVDVRLGYKWVKETAKNELSVEGRYSRNRSESDNDYVQAQTDPAIDTVPTLQRVDDNNGRNNYALQADYVVPLWEGARLETGYKGEMQRFTGDVASMLFDYSAGEFRNDSSVSNDYIYDRTIHGAYLTYGQQFDQFGVQAGLRAEQFSTSFDQRQLDTVYKNDFFSLFPSAFVTWRPDESVQLKTSYSRRIQRPRPHQLNPFSGFGDALFRRQGNPNLRPEYTDAVEFTATWFSPVGSITVQPYYRHTTDVIRWFERLDTNGFSVLTFENLAEQSNWGSDVIWALRLGDNFSGFTNLSLFQSQTDGSNIQSDLGSNAFGWRLSANLTWKPLDWLDVQLSGFYSAPMTVEQGRIRGFRSVNLAFQAKVLDNQGRISLRINDPFRMQGFEATRDDALFHEEVVRKFNSQSIGLGFSYTFGTQDRRRNNQRGDDDGGGMDPMNMR